MDSRKRKLVIFATTLLVALALTTAAGCSPKAADNAGANTDNSDGAKTTEAALDTPYTWSMSSDCATCHSSEGAGTDTDTHPQAAAHSAARLACVDCHTLEPVLTSTHKDITLADKPATRVTELTVNPQTCIDCHGDLNQVAKLTESSQALRDDQGLVVNPHQRPEGVSHNANPATCTSCHNNHSQKLATDAKKYCASCHHRGVWQCGTCHTND